MNSSTSRIRPSRWCTPPASRSKNTAKKWTPEVRGNIESAISNLEGKLKDDNKASIDAALKQLNDASIELGKAVYESTTGDAGATGGADPASASTGSDDDDVIDAEYEVKD